MQNPFLKHTGLAVPLDKANIDTDQMVPKQFCLSVSRDGYGEILFFNWRYLSDGSPNPHFVLNQPRYRGASVLLTRENCGCGSSREHAPWAIAGYGFRVIVAPSYADIFYNNCIKNGILPVIVDASAMDLLFQRASDIEDYRITADLENSSIGDDFGLNIGIKIDPARRRFLLSGLDEIGMTLQHSADIAAYESRSGAGPTGRGVLRAIEDPTESCLLR